MQLLLSQGRIARLLASLTYELQDSGIYDDLPPAVSRHFLTAQLVHEKQRRDLAYDCENIRLALEGAGEKLVLLKGAAYLQAGLPFSRGRLITDIDIIVPHRSLGAVEAALHAAGWAGGDISPYDDRYYRNWGHEIPPLTHLKRDTTLDVHHNILPPTAGPNVNAELLFEGLIEVKPGIFTLSLQDMVIHSATHLFHEGEFHHGLRDLWDLDRMLREFPGREPRFWDELISRARELQLLDSLFHGLNYAHQVFGTPLPDHTLADAGNWPRLLRKPVMDFLFLRAFRPHHPKCELPFTALALNLLYVRSHYLRMPLYLLLPHLARKAWMRHTQKKEPTPERHADQQA